MKYYVHKSISERLYQAEEAIALSRSKPELRDALAQQGYGDKAFIIGAGYVATVRAIDVLRREQLGKQVIATARVEEIYRELRQNFDVDRKVVRLVLRDHLLYADKLGLGQKTSKERSAFILQARHFYQAVSEDEFAAQLLGEGYGMNPGFMTSRLQVVVALEEALAHQQYMIGQMQQITQERNKAMKALDAWMSSYIAIARVVFKHDEPKLHKLGIRVKQRKAKQK